MLAQFLQFLFSGVTVGATYALAALGFTLIYNASNVINFAQGKSHQTSLPRPNTPRNIEV